MTDLLVGLGLVLVIEGILWAAFPRLAIRMSEAAMANPELTLRMAGLASACAGLGIVWLIRG